MISERRLNGSTKYTAQGRKAFERDELIQNWVVHHLQVIGEVTRHLSSRLQEHHPEVPWSRIIGMRNILVHDYFAIDTEAVWQAVERDLPELKRSIETIVHELGD